MSQPRGAAPDAAQPLFVQVDWTPRNGNEAAEINWIPLDETPAMTASGEAIGLASMIGLQTVLLDRR